MLELPVKLLRVKVMFNPTSPQDVNPITLWCDDFYVDRPLNSQNLSVSQGITLIAFDLFQLPGGDASNSAVFGTTSSNINAITWPDGSPEGTSTPPEVFLVQTFSPSHCTIIDFNTDKNPNSHSFWVNVFYNGTAYRQDPTIVNQPPMGDG